MMSFCKKSVHSFLNLTHHCISVVNMDSVVNINGEKPSCALPLGHGLGLITATGDTYKTPNVLESATVKSSSPSSTPPSSPPPPSSSLSSSLLFKKDPGGRIGFIDDIGRGVDGLMSCTESLGFESSDERRVDDDDENIDELCSRARPSKAKWRKLGGERRRQVKKFPPPLSSLNHNGQPCFYLRPVRKDGRLELTEVRIDRPEILRASGEDGRLRLHLVSHDDEEELNTPEEEEEEFEEEQGGGEEDEEGVKEEEEEEGWGLTVNGESFRRCHELVTHPHHRDHHHHHNLHVWRQQCVTTR